MIQLAPSGVIDVDKLLTVEEAADKLRLSPAGVRQLLRRGVLRGSRIGKYWRIQESALVEYVRSTQNVPSEDVSEDN